MGSGFAFNFIHLWSLGSTSLNHLGFVCVCVYSELQWIAGLCFVLFFFLINDGFKVNTTEKELTSITTEQKDSQFGCNVFSLMKSK